MLMSKLHLKRFNLPGIMWGGILILIVFSLLTKKFLTPVNILLIARYSCILIIASIGMTMAILVSQSDMSVGSGLSLAGVIMAICINRGVNVFLAIAISLLMGMIVGLFNGIMISVWKFDFWIITFAMMGVGAGLALVFSNGATVTADNPILNWLGNGKFLGIYIIIYITVILLIIMLYVLRKTTFGYNIYSIGGSEQCASLCGIEVQKNRIGVYILSGLFAAIAGVLLAAMGNSASPVSGSSYSFDAMAAVVIGGASFSGGKGTLFGTIMGCLFLRTLANGLNLMGVPVTWQSAIIGIVTVIILVAEVLSEKRKNQNSLRRRYIDET